MARRASPRDRCIGGTTYWPAAWACSGSSTGGSGSATITSFARAAARRAASRVVATTANTGWPSQRSVAPGSPARMGSSCTKDPQSLTPGMSRRREHVHHAGQRAQPVQVDRLQQHAVRHGRQAQRGVQRAGQLGQVVGVGRAAADVQRGRFVGPGSAHLGRDRHQQGRVGGSVHVVVSRAQTDTASAGSGLSARVSSQKRFSRFCATCIR